MSISDFLFEGQPPPSVTTYGSTVATLPTWLSDYTQGLINKANTVAGQPYQPYAGPRIAGFTDQQKQAQQMAGQNVNSWKPSFDKAGDSLEGALTQATPYLTQAGSLYSSSTDPSHSATAAASPHMANASATFPGHVSEYMDPYVENVINRGSQLALRNFNENVMPGVRDEFIKSGQYGSSAHMREADRSSRDLAEGLQAQSMGALSQAYQQAGSLFNQDAGREAQLAGTAGSLATADRNALTTAASGLGSLGATTGSLALNTAQGLTDLGTKTQEAGARDVSQLAASGQQQQNQVQKNLDLAHGDFQTQTDYPKSQIEWLSGILRGTPVDKATTTTQTAPLQGATYGKSNLENIGALIDIWNSIKGSSEGGLARTGYARGGRIVRRPPVMPIRRARGGLALAGY